MTQSGLSKWLLLVHDKRGSAAVPFDQIIRATPKELMKARGAGGVYDTVRTSDCETLLCSRLNEPTL